MTAGYNYGSNDGEPEHYAPTAGNFRRRNHVEGGSKLGN